MTGPARRALALTLVIGGALAPAGNAQATATFAAPLATPVAGISPLATPPTVTDLNGDGHLDVVTIENGGTMQLSTVRGDGTGLFVPFAFASGLSGSGSFGFSVGRVNADALPDVVTSADAGVRLGLNAAGAFPASTAVAPAAIQPVLADLNGDGKADLVLPSGTTVDVRLNDGAGTFLPASSTLSRSPAVPTPFAYVGDVTGDGSPDIVTWSRGQIVPSDPDGRLAVFPNDGTGHFPATPAPGSVIQFTDNTAPEFITYRPVIVDINGDGAKDFVAPTAEGGSGQRRVRVALNSGAGTFSVPSSATVPIAGYADGGVAVADVDLDGRPDVAVTEGTPAAGGVSILYNTGSFAAPLSGPVSAYSAAGPLGVPRSVAAGDFNEDGAPDLGFLDNGAGGSAPVNFQYLRSLVAKPVRSAPASLSFPGTVALGTNSAPQTITITNTGGGSGGAANLKVASASADGDFLKTGDTCSGAAVPKNGTCRITLRFSPSAEGPRTGTLTISDNSDASPGTITLSGNGAGLPAGPAGAGGAPGAGGRDGTNGRNGRDATVTCKPGKPKGGKVKVTCSVKLAKSAVRARLSRNGVVVARGTVRGGVARFDTSRLRPGRYTLTVVLRRDGRVVRHRSGVTLP